MKTKMSILMEKYDIKILQYLYIPNVYNIYCFSCQRIHQTQHEQLSMILIEYNNSEYWIDLINKTIKKVEQERDSDYQFNQFDITNNEVTI